MRQCGMIFLPMLAPVSRQRRRWIRHALLCTVVGTLLSSCSALPLTYNHAEGLLLWKIDRYFKLSSEQERLVKAWLADFHSWHRQTELPRYVEFLRQVQDRWSDGVSPEEIDWTFDTFFFSRRRRHTRWTGDWSSDVCSSDLETHPRTPEPVPALVPDAAVRPA